MLLRITLLLLSALFYCKSYAMENQPEVKSFEQIYKKVMGVEASAICSKMKQLAHYSPESEYDRVISEFKNNGLTVFDCVNLKTQEREKNLFKKMGLNTGDVDFVQSCIQKQKDMYQSNAQNNVSCSELIPDELCQKIKQVKENHGVKGDLCVDIHRYPDGASIEASRETSRDFSLNSKYWKLLIGEGLIKNGEAMQVVPHELQHALNYDQDAENCLRDWFNDVKDRTTQSLTISYRDKYLRFQESRADKLAAAGNLADAQELQTHFCKNITMSDAKDNNEDRLHPTNKNRCYYLTKIVKMLEAEKRVNTSTRQSARSVCSMNGL